MIRGTIELDDKEDAIRLINMLCEQYEITREDLDL